MTEIKPDTPHPEFSAQSENYELVKDFYKGVGAVRAKGETHLPKTAGMINEDDQRKADRRYKAFVMRATYPGVFRHTVSSVVGITTQKEPSQYEVPASWDSVEQCATRDGIGLRGLQALCVRQVSKMGRIGLMTDLRSDQDQVPVIVPFYSDQIINWRTAVVDGKRQLTMLVIKKQEAVQGDDYWSDKMHDVVEVYELTRAGLLLRRFVKSDDKKEWEEQPGVKQPRMRKQATGAEVIKDDSGGGFRLPEIPFTPITTQGLQIDPADPPFLDLVHKLKDIYIGSANYREALSMYEPTPVVTGLTQEWIQGGFAPKYMGVGRVWTLPVNSKAEMLEYQGRNITDIRQALIDDAGEADRLATQPFERVTSQAESGESKKEKAKSKTNVIREIHLNTANGIQEALRKGARWLGEDPEKVIFAVADDLDNQDMRPDELKELVSANLSGLIPDFDAYTQLKAGGKTTLTYDQWKAAREGGETGALAGGSV